MEKGRINMKKIILSLIITSIFLYANKVYDISNEEYLQYKNNPKKMESIFNNKYHLKLKKKISITNEIVKKEIKKNDIVKVEKIKVKKISIRDKVKKEIKSHKKVTKKEFSKENSSKPITPLTKTIAVKNIATKAKNKKIKVLSIEEVNNKLKYDKIINNKNINVLIFNIKDIFKDSKNQYEIKDIIFVLKQIQNKKISSFESKIYLKQIKKLIRDIN